MSQFGYTFNGTINAFAQDLILKANINESTGIIAGDLAGTGNVSRNTNGDTIFDILTDAVSGTANQWRFNHDTKTIDIKPLIGQNLTNSIILRYDTRIIALSNLASFNVTDNGDAVTTVSAGRVSAT